jgi:predicted RNA-binding protein YlqC (UPF0109 family)
MDAPEALLEFLSYVVANLIDHPQQASIAIGHTSGGTVSYRVQLAPEDVKRVIGKNGLTVSSIRSLLNVAAARHDLRVSLKVGAARDLDGEESADEEAKREAEQAVKAEEKPELRMNTHGLRDSRSRFHPFLCHNSRIMPGHRLQDIQAFLRPENTNGRSQCIAYHRIGSYHRAGNSTGEAKTRFRIDDVRISLALDLDILVEISRS